LQDPKPTLDTCKAIDSHAFHADVSSHERAPAGVCGLLALGEVIWHLLMLSFAGNLVLVAVAACAIALDVQSRQFMQSNGVQMFMGVAILVAGLANVATSTSRLRRRPSA
jgi:hypothetical protein